MKLDRLDKQIIIALEDDGRRPYRDIARDLGVAEATIRARVGRLVDSGMIHITAVGDPLKLGVEVAAITLIRTRPGYIQATAAVLAGYPNIRFVGTSFGSADIVIQALHHDLESLHAFIAEELPRSAPGIISTETLQLAKVLKSSWEWRAWFEGEEGDPSEDAAEDTAAEADGVGAPSGNELGGSTGEEVGGGGRP